MARPKSVKIILDPSEINSMTVEFNFDEDSAEDEKGETRDEKIVRILQLFSRLSPEKQEEVLKFIDYLDRKVNGEESGQDQDS